MALELLSDEMRADVEPLQPDYETSELGRRPRVPDLAALTGILVILKTGIQWKDQPLEIDYSSVRTWWLRLWKWQAASVWKRLHQNFL